MRRSWGIPRDRRVVRLVKWCVHHGAIAERSKQAAGRNLTAGTTRRQVVGIVDGRAIARHTVARQPGLTAFWWNDAGRSCVRTVNANGRYKVVEAVAAANCGR